MARKSADSPAVEMATESSLVETKWTTATRKAYHAAHPENFAGPGMSFPIKDRSDVGDAWNLAGHADDPDAVRAKIKAIAKRLGFSDTLPDTAKGDNKTESIPGPSAPGAFSHIQKIATLTTCWLEDDAVSLNGRQYPREAVDRLIQSAQVQLSTPGASPLTCYISHAAADQDDSLKLVGRLTRVWREGARAMASIDIAPTSAGRDAATLAANGYLITQSLRASNAELRREKDSTWPVVGGANLRLDGIDFTSTPGIQVARIQDVALAEHAGETSGLQCYQEVFQAHPATMLLEYEESTMTAKKMSQEPSQQLAEVAGGNMPMAYNPTSGNTVGMTNDPPQDAYAQRMYQQPQMTSGLMQGMIDVSGVDLREAHDHVAIVQNRACAPGRESARWLTAFARMNEQQQHLVEAGRTLSTQNDAHLDGAHHAIARHLGMECAGANNKMAEGSRYNPDGDGDDDRTAGRNKNPDFGLDQMDGVTPLSQESRPPLRPPTTPKGPAPMSMDQAARLLEQAGWTLQRPKTEAEKLQEQLEASRAEFSAQLAALRAEFSAQQQGQPVTEAEHEAAPQRRSLVTGAPTTVIGPNGIPVSPKSIRGQLYKKGQYLRERLNTLDWYQLADRTAPIPEDLQLDWLLKEFEQLYAVQYDDRFHVLSAADAELR